MLEIKASGLTAQDRAKRVDSEMRQEQAKGTREPQGEAKRPHSM
jgi:hypothetical protein